jgi:hypothetical protein
MNLVSQLYSTGGRLFRAIVLLVAISGTGRARVDIFMSGSSSLTWKVFQLISMLCMNKDFKLLKCQI